MEEEIDTRKFPRLPTHHSLLAWYRIFHLLKHRPLLVLGVCAFGYAADPFINEPTVSFSPLSISLAIGAFCVIMDPVLQVHPELWDLMFVHRHALTRQRRREIVLRVLKNPAILPHVLESQRITHAQFRKWICEVVDRLDPDDPRRRSLRRLLGAQSPFGGTSLSRPYSE